MGRANEASKAGVDLMKKQNMNRVEAPSRARTVGHRRPSSSLNEENARKIRKEEISAPVASASGSGSGFLCACDPSVQLFNDLAARSNQLCQLNG